MEFHRQAHFFQTILYDPKVWEKQMDSKQCGFKTTPMPTWAKSLLASKTPYKYGIEMKAGYVSRGRDRGRDQSAEQEIDC